MSCTFVVGVSLGISVGIVVSIKSVIFIDMGTFLSFFPNFKAIGIAIIQVTTNIAAATITIFPEVFGGGVCGV